ncbi:transcription factor MYB1R1-like [Olea europaea var. sylvestris]|uniref:transcription factor MYB1R1-like n=1 Tax=Olea europaea var. sylvestris TaxID=158386 RepID=UPI000C1D8D19|nr:transcription factor MYB1R1-like [Olea europaea var. sylvestris]
MSPACGELHLPSSTVSGGGGSGEIMLFGVRVKVDPMRKSVSMNNLSDYPRIVSNNNQNINENSNMAVEDGGATTCYASADDAALQPAGGSRERKRGVPWTEEEHKLFLLGLQKVGKGDWRGISRNYVKTRTPTQVASHAQKYFLRRSNLNRRRRRSSLFDITTDSVNAMPIEECKGRQDGTSQPVLQPISLSPPDSSNISGFSVVPFSVTIGPVLSPMQVENPIENPPLSQHDQTNNSSALLIHPASVLPMSTASTVIDLNQNVPTGSSPLSLSLSLSSGQDRERSSSTRYSVFQVMSSFKNGDSSIISVA